MTTLRERLAERYPTWWGRCIGVEVPDGWEPLVERLCADIAAALGPRAEQLRVRQVKEKLAELVVYWDHPDLDAEYVLRRWISFNNADRMFEIVAVDVRTPKRPQGGDE